MHMPQSRRYLFHGHAAALGGRIVRIGEGAHAQLHKDGFIDLPASSLTVSGGRSTASVKGDQLKGTVAGSVVRFGTALAVSEGFYDDVKGHFEATQNKRAYETLTATTKVRTELTDLEVGLAGGPLLRIRGLRGGFTSQSGTASGETPVQLDPDTAYDGVTFLNPKTNKSHTLVVEVEPSVFREHDTFTKLTNTASDATFMKKFGHTLFLQPADKKLAPRAPGLVRTDGGAVQGTIVKPLRWKGEPFPKADIDPAIPNAVRIPALGTLFFGEISVARRSRRLIMIRATLGSPAGGDIAVCDYQNNGEWS